MPYPSIGAATTTTIGNGVTTVDCQKQVRSWRLLRSLLALLIPTCTNCTSFNIDHHQEPQRQHFSLPNPHHPSSTTVTGTIFGFRRGKVSFCIQSFNPTSSSSSSNPILLLQLAIPTTVLAREMRGGVLRIALETTTTNNSSSSSSSSSLLSTPVWTMYCNGRRVGYAVKRRPSRADMVALRLMASVVVGAGIIGPKELESDDELMYLRGNFERVSAGSSQAESFHLIDPHGSLGQELSIFLFRSQSS